MTGIPVVSQFMCRQVCCTGKGTTAIRLDYAVFKCGAHGTDIGQPDGAACEAGATEELNDVMGRVVGAVPYGTNLFEPCLDVVAAVGIAAV